MCKILPSAAPYISVQQSDDLFDLFPRQLGSATEFQLAHQRFNPHIRCAKISLAPHICVGC